MTEPTSSDRIVWRAARRGGLAGAATAAAIVFLLSAAVTAWSFFNGGPQSAQASALVGAVNPPGSPTATQTGTDVAITWTAATLTSGTAVDGYEVTRSDGHVVCGGSALVTALSCTDSAVPSGSYTYAVKAAFKGFTATARTPAFTVLTAPTISGYPASPSASTTPAFSFSGGHGGGYECKLDGAAYGSCTSADTISGVADGTHTFSVRATGGPSSGPAATHTWTLDTTAPTLTGTPSSPTASTTATFTASHTEAAYTFACKLAPATSFTPCPAFLSALTDGQHTMSIEALDADGVATAPVAYTWKVDTAAPSITSMPADGDTSTAPAFAFSDAEASYTFKCAIDSATFTTCASPTSYSGLSGGAHTFAVEAVSIDGAATTSATYTWHIDPSISSLSPTSLTAGASNVKITVNGTAFESGAQFTTSDPDVTVNSTTVNSATKLTANISVAAAAALNANVSATVTNPDATAGSKSGALTVNPAPTVTSTSPTPVPEAATNATVALYGTGFESGATVAVSGTGVSINSVSYVSSTQLNLNVTVAAITATTARTVTVTNPDGSSASGAALTVGNERIGTPSGGITARAGVDSWSGATIDTGQSITQAGTISSIDYYAQALHTIELAMANSSDVFQWVSPPISVTSYGLHSYTLATPIYVKPGYRLAVWSQGPGGVIPYDNTSASSIDQSGNGAGAPSAGSGMGVAFSGQRQYSFGADVSTFNDTTPPTGGALMINGTAATASGSTSLTDLSTFTVDARSDYSETPSSTQSGLTSSTLTVQSASTTGTLPGAGSCNAPGSGGPFTTPVTVSGTAQPSGILAGYCYTYTLTGTDAAGNHASISTTVQVAMKLWASADSVSQANGTPVGGVSDSSPFQNNLTTHATAPTLATSVWNGHSALTFNGSAADLSTAQSMASGSAPYDVFVVARPNNNLSGAGMLGWGVAGTNLRVSFRLRTDCVGLWTYWWAHDQGACTSISTSGPSVYETYWDGSTRGMALNGTILVSATDSGKATVATPLYLGASDESSQPYPEPYNGQIAEAVVYEGVLTTAQRSAITSYLLSRYAINPQPSSISPTSGDAGVADSTVTIGGTNFTSGDSVSFANSGIKVNSVTVNSSTQLTANISIAAGATAGLGNVTVAGPSQMSSTLSNAFTVNAGTGFLADGSAASTSGQHNGAWSGTAAYTTGSSGGGDQAFSFSGTGSKVLMDPALGAFGTNPATIAFEIRTTQGGQSSIFSERAACGNPGEGWVDLRMTSGRPNVEFGGSSYTQATSSTAVNDGQWHNVVIHRSSAGTITITVDGVQRASATNAVANINPSVSFGLDSSPCVNQDGTVAFSGAIDDLVVTNGN